MLAELSYIGESEAAPLGMVKAHDTGDGKAALTAVMHAAEWPKLEGVQSRPSSAHAASQFCIGSPSTHV
jgi:hypothetical protein